VTADQGRHDADHDERTAPVPTEEEVLAALEVLRADGRTTTDFKEVFNRVAPGHAEAVAAEQAATGQKVTDLVAPSVYNMIKTLGDGSHGFAVAETGDGELTVTFAETAAAA
jgi:hypothetical protein